MQQHLSPGDRQKPPFGWPKNLHKFWQLVRLGHPPPSMQIVPRGVGSLFPEIYIKPNYKLYTKTILFLFLSTHI